jgi:ABC-type dipeptide/oligopeptide/nickel transport system permease subunit
VSAVLPETGLGAEGIGPRPSAAGFMRRLFRERPSALVGGTLLLLFLVVALLSKWIEPYPINAQVGPVFEPPSASHWFGLDDSGYDMTSLLIEGTKVSLIVGFAATLV